ncbi:hypothetical protein [Streptomyces sp. NPDC087297]|uniref:hypothetical protein n=1 Tax=Streptomyces sp. NPDC087297 TaxID=3365778 RepID=UPI0038023B84
MTAPDPDFALQEMPEAECVRVSHRAGHGADQVILGFGPPDQGHVQGGRAWSPLRIG